MSSSEINLIAGKTFSLEKRIKEVKIFRVIAIISLVIVSLISIILFIITITLPISTVKNEQEQTLSSISVLHNKLASYSLVVDRVQNIKAVISTRKYYGKTLDEILKNVPPSLAVGTMTLDAGEIKMIVTGSSLQDVNLLINNLITLNNGKKFIKNLIINSLSLNAQGGTVSLSFQADKI